MSTAWSPRWAGRSIPLPTAMSRPRPFPAPSRWGWCWCAEEAMKDIVELLEDYIPEDQRRWAKLASTVGYRRLELLLLREILVELRKLNQTLALSRQASSGQS